MDTTFETARDWPLLCVMCLMSVAKSGTVVLVPPLAIVSLTVVLSLPVSYSLSLSKPADWSSHSRVRELCVHKQRGHEGKTIKGFQLSQVFIVSTPGLIYQSGDENLDVSSPQTCHFESFSRNHPSAKLQLYPEVLDDKLVMKKGDSRSHSAFKVFSPVPNSHKCITGKMTSLGIAQSIWLGEYFSFAYHQLWSLNKLVATAQTVGNEVLYQTASAVLYGLLHEKQFVRNHVKKFGKNFGLAGNRVQDSIRDHSHFYVKASFEKEHHLFKDQLSPTSDRENIDHTVSVNLSAKNILSSSALKYCSFTRNSGAHEHASTDEESYSRSFSISDVLTLSDSHNEYLSQNSFFQSYAVSRTSQFRDLLRVWMQTTISKHNPEINLVTADDLFLFSLLTSFNKTVNQHIPPVSRLVFEKFVFNISSPVKSSQEVTKGTVSVGSTDNLRFSPNNDNHFFRVLFNGQVITGEIGGCGLDPLVSLGLCSQLRLLQASDSFDHKREEL